MGADSVTADSFATESDGGHVRVSVHGREIPTTADFWDANWLRMTISVRVGAVMGSFTADVTATLRDDEVDDFRVPVGRARRGARNRA